MTDTRWMSYDELAVALAITPDSARRLAFRRKWPRKAGNDGKVRVGVPAERIPDQPPVVTPVVSHDISPDALPDSPPDASPDIGPVIRALSQHIERLEKELETVKAERETERARAAGLALTAAEGEALKAILDSERRRLEEVRLERDGWRSQAERLTLALPAPVSWWPFRKRQRA
jgi:hypothetical protein